MTNKRLLFTLPVLALLAACGGTSSGNDSRAASGEVLEGTISDEMLPVDRVRSEPPLEDPEAFARARSPGATPGAPATVEGEEAVEGEQPAVEGAEGAAPAPTPQTADE